MNYQYTTARSANIADCYAGCTSPLVPSPFFPVLGMIDATRTNQSKICVDCQVKFSSGSSCGGSQFFGTAYLNGANCVNLPSDFFTFASFRPST